MEPNDTKIKFAKILQNIYKDFEYLKLAEYGKGIGW